MTPAAAIDMLDRQIAAHGQPVVLRRVVPDAAAITLALDAFVRGYRSDELIGGIEQGDTMVVFSPTGIAGSPFEAEIPARGDRLVFDDRPRHIEMVDPVRIRGAIFRYNLQVKG